MRTSSHVVAVVVLTSLAGVIVGACNQGGGSGWTFLGGDEKNTFNNTKEKTLTTGNAGRLGPAWTSKDFGTVNGAPAVVDGVAYVLSNTGLYAVDVDTGRQLWRNAEMTGTSAPTFNKGWLFVHDGKAVLRAIDAKDGRQIWQAKVDPHPKANGFSSPLVHENYVIVGSASSDEVTAIDFSAFRGGVVAYNRTSGAELWRTYTVDPPHNGGAVWSSVSIDAELGIVYATNGNNYTGEASLTSDSIFALRLRDGAKIWWTQLYAGDVFTVPTLQSPDYDFGTNPIVFDGVVEGRRRKLVGAGQKSGVFSALDRQTGTVVWSRMLSTEGGMLIGGIFNNGAFDGRNIIVAANRASSAAPGSEPANGESVAQQPTTSVLFALNPGDGAIVWERQLPAWVWAPITIANGIGFVAYESQMQAFDTSTGAKLFNYPTGGTITSAPVVADGAVFFGSGLSYFVGKADGTLHSLVLDGNNFPSDAGSTGDAGGAATFTAVYTQVLVGGGCSAMFCHGGNTGNFTIGTQSETYEALVGVAASGPACATSGLTRVVPGNPDASLLYNKLVARPPACGQEMPPAALLPQPQLDLVRSWIAAGALNN